MAKYPRLHKRGGRYYVRARVPTNLVDTLGKREIKKTLGTSDYRVAREQLPLASAMIDAMFAEARRKLQLAPVTQLSKTEIEQIVLQWFYVQQGERATQRDFRQATFDRRELLDELDIDEGELLEGENPNALASAQGLANRLLEQHNCVTSAPMGQIEVFA